MWRCFSISMCLSSRTYSTIFHSWIEANRHRTVAPSTITRDLVIATHARMLGQTDSRAEARVSEARSASAIPYVPGELAAELTAGTNGICS